MGFNFNDSAAGKYFKMTERKTTLGTEILAGLTTFLTLALQHGQSLS